VLVRVAAAPINPSDLSFLQGNYGLRKPLPVVPGFEGSGTVVAAGSGLLPRFYLGRRVACAVQDGRDGTWAEYVVVPAATCLPLPKEVSLEAGAMSLVNPLTAWAFFETARRGGHKAMANTAAASALGRMVLRFGLRTGFPVVHIVRRPEQADLMRGLGAGNVLDSSTPDFPELLRKVFSRVGVTLAWDALGGEMTGQLLEALPRGGHVLVYGWLSGARTTSDVGALIFDGKQVGGFWLTSWLAQGGTLRTLRAINAVRRHLPDELASEVQARYPLAEAQAAVESYTAAMTQGKVLLTP
jgi:NADPH:quinone reductase-like Zn-dependent oxidoreductase